MALRSHSLASQLVLLTASAAFSCSGAGGDVARADSMSAAEPSTSAASSGESSDASQANEFIAQVTIERSRVAGQLVEPAPLTVPLGQRPAGPAMPATLESSNPSAGGAVIVDRRTAADAPSPELQGELAAGATDFAPPHAELTVNTGATPAQASASAIAQFIRAPHLELRGLELAGLATRFPEIGECGTVEPDDRGTSFTSLPFLSLVDAGEVKVEAVRSASAALASGEDLKSNDDRLKLAPRAFPSLPHVASGVVYTSRDRSAETLPGDATYRITATGSQEIESLSFAANSPAELTGVTLGGVPLENTQSVRLDAPLDLTWDIGANADLVFVDIVSSDGRHSVRCSFDDAEGAGSIPADVLERLAKQVETETTVHAGFRGRVLVHRYRQATQPLGELQTDGAPTLNAFARIQFDFELTHTLTFRANGQSPVDPAVSPNAPDQQVSRWSEEAELVTDPR